MSKYQNFSAEPSKVLTMQEQLYWLYSTQMHDQYTYLIDLLEMKGFEVGFFNRWIPYTGLLIFEFY